MPRKPDPTLKPAIISKVTEHLRSTKIEDISVRSLGRVLGTSAYPIVYHFGTRAALIDAVVDSLAAGIAHAELSPDADDMALTRYLVTVFGGLDDPDRSLAARLTFELGAVEAIDERVKQRDVHREQVAVVAEWCRAHGYGPADAERSARAAVLAARGAQWSAIVDPLHTDVDRAMREIAHKLVSGAEFALAG
jgi:AcrR family transcriptional regulator